MIDFDSLVLGPCVAAFGQPVVYMPGAGGAVMMNGVFDAAYEDIKYEGETPVATTKPMLGMQVSDFAGQLPDKGELFQIGGTVAGGAVVNGVQVGGTMTGGQYYAVIEPPHADSHGHLKVFLMLASEQAAP